MAPKRTQQNGLAHWFLAALDSRPIIFLYHPAQLRFALNTSLQVSFYLLIAVRLGHKNHFLPQACRDLCQAYPAALDDQTLALSPANRFLQALLAQHRRTAVKPATSNA